jgi:hypothetical protein
MILSHWPTASFARRRLAGVFDGQDGPLAVCSPTVIVDDAALENDAVARNDERYGIRTHRLTHSSGSAAVSDCRRDVLVSRERPNGIFRSASQTLIWKFVPRTW